MQSGNMYMMPLDSPWYALVPTRSFLTWRWNLHGYPLHKRSGSAAIYESNQTPIASNIRHDEIIALMKLMGAINIGD